MHSVAVLTLVLSIFGRPCALGQVLQRVALVHAGVLAEEGEKMADFYRRERSKKFIKYLIFNSSK